MVGEIQGLRKGEKEFLKHFEEHPHFETLRKEEKKEGEAKKEISEFLKKLTEEIEELPEVKREAQIHHESLKNISSTLAQAVYVTLEEGILEGIAFIKKLNNPHLLDQLHDILAGHFYDLLIKQGKLKPIK
jgi:hypothetical protein